MQYLDDANFSDFLKSERNKVTIYNAFIKDPVGVESGLRYGDALRVNAIIP